MDGLLNVKLSTVAAEMSGAMNALEVRLDTRIQQVEQRRRDNNEMATRMDDAERIRKLEMAEKQEPEAAPSPELQTAASSMWLPTAVVIGTWAYETPASTQRDEAATLLKALTGLDYVVEAPQRASIVKVVCEDPKMASQARFRLRKALAANPGANKWCSLERNPDTSDRRRHLKCCSDRLRQETGVECTTRCSTGEVTVGDAAGLRMLHGGSALSRELAGAHERSEVGGGTLAPPPLKRPRPRECRGGGWGRAYRRQHITQHRHSTRQGLRQGEPSRPACREPEAKKARSATGANLKTEHAEGSRPGDQQREESDNAPQCMRAPRRTAVESGPHEIGRTLGVESPGKPLSGRYPRET